MTIRLAGEAGQGVESGGAGFASALSHGGLWLHTYSEYMSRIRGGLNFFQMRVSDRPLWAHTEGVHILLAFSPEAVTDYGPHLVVGGNLKVAEAGYKVGRDQYAAKFDWKVSPLKDRPDRMQINGNQAIAVGAIAAGCRFMSGYPMTPASSILEFMAGHAKKYDIVVKQTEDEIAAICFAIGAGNAGARAMTATSGGGFSLMVEALGLAGMAEVPVVIVEAQRPGPSTGMPTKAEQGDLLFALFASQGEFPRIVLAPGTQEDCFHTTVRAFNLAEKWQCPVIVMTDFYLTTMTRLIPPSEFPIDRVTIDRGELLTSQQLDRLAEPYLRYKDTPSGISPRAMPGHPKAVHQTCSDEH